MDLLLPMKQFFHPISKILEKPYVSILGYPTATKNQIESRYAEINHLGIEAISFFGNTKINNISILGKGHNGLIALAKKNKKIVALKIRRVDSQQQTMNRESLFLKIANDINIGPNIIESSKNFIVMEYINGEIISKWIDDVSHDDFNHVIKTILIDCYILDKYNIDHGELNNASKHIIISNNHPTILDFENASVTRKVSNVTSVIQYMYIRSSISKKVNNDGKITNEKLIELLRLYKNNNNKKNFTRVLKFLNL